MSDALPDARPPSSGGALGRVESALGTAAACVLFAIMSVTLADVIGRYAFNAPLPAGYETIQIGMALLVFLVVPGLAAREEEIRVDIVQNAMPRRLRPALRLISRAVSLVVLIGFAWLLWWRGESFLLSREITANLRVPLAPIAFFVALSWLAAAAAVAWNILAWRQRRRPDAPA